MVPWRYNLQEAEVMERRAIGVCVPPIWGRRTKALDRLGVSWTMC